jgi:hypothetical protein
MNTKEIKELASKIQGDAFDLRLASSQFYMHVAVDALTKEKMRNEIRRMLRLVGNIEDALETLESKL